MSVSVSLALFPDQAEVIQEGTQVTGRQLHDLAETLGDRLRGEAKVVDQLQTDGWDVKMGRFGLMITHPQVGTEAEARARLEALGIDTRALAFEEWEEVDL